MIAPAWSPNIAPVFGVCLEGSQGKPELRRFYLRPLRVWHDFCVTVAPVHCFRSGETHARLCGSDIADLLYGAGVSTEFRQPKPALLERRGAKCRIHVGPAREWQHMRRSPSVVVQREHRRFGQLGSPLQRQEFLLAQRRHSPGCPCHDRKLPEFAGTQCDDAENGKEQSASLGVSNRMEKSRAPAGFRPARTEKFPPKRGWFTTLLVSPIHPPCDRTRT
jgi:hypothetical protein